MEQPEFDPDEELMALARKQPYRYFYFDNQYYRYDPSTEIMDVFHAGSWQVLFSEARVVT